MRQVSVAGVAQAELKARLHRLGRVAAEVLGQRPNHVAAPGGFDRASLRLHFDTQTVIVTERANSRAVDLEEHTLKALSAVGAAVPRYLGRAGHVLFQEDLGGERLSAALIRAEGPGQRALAERAMRSLWRLKSDAQKAGLTRGLPPLALSADWITGFVHGVRGLSDTLGLYAPKLDHEDIIQRLSLRPQHFVKWDARAGNAVVQPDGRIAWFDWEVSGRRGGIEDLAILVADEFWPLSAEASLAALLAASPPLSDRVQHAFLLFAVFQSADRLRILNERIARHGWMEANAARALDQAGTAPELVRHLAERAGDLADQVALTRPLMGWFPAVAETIVKQAAP